MNNDFEIGKVVGTFGIKGDIKIYPTTDDIQRFSRLSQLKLIQNGVIRYYDIEQVRYQKGLPVVKLKDFSSIEEASVLKGAIVLVAFKDAIPLNDNEYYHRDLIGLHVVADDGERLGTLSQIIETGANDVYIIKNDNTPDLLIPAIKECILGVNIKEQHMLVHLLDGLRDKKPGD